MNDYGFKQKMIEQLSKRANSILEEKAHRFAALLIYELKISNMELSGQNRNINLNSLYDIDFNSIKIDFKENQSDRYSVSVSIDENLTKDLSNEEMSFLNTYVLRNVREKMKNER